MRLLRTSIVAIVCTIFVFSINSSYVHSEPVVGQVKTVKTHNMNDVRITQQYMPLIKRPVAGRNGMAPRLSKEERSLVYYKPISVIGVDKNIKKLEKRIDKFSLRLTSQRSQISSLHNRIVDMQTMLFLFATMGGIIVILCGVVFPFLLIKTGNNVKTVAKGGAAKKK